MRKVVVLFMCIFALAICAARADEDADKAAEKTATP